MRKWPCRLGKWKTKTHLPEGVDGSTIVGHLESRWICRTTVEDWQCGNQERSDPNKGLPAECLRFLNTTILCEETRVSGDR
jgi:hypothetical protein